MGEANKYAKIVEQLKTKKKLDEGLRISPLDLHNPSEAKRKMWAKHKSKELEELYAAIATSKREIPENKWDAWDLEAFNIIGDIIATRRVAILRDEIARMMELSGQHYALSKDAFYKKQRLLKDLEDKKED